MDGELKFLLLRRGWGSARFNINQTFRRTEVVVRALPLMSGSARSYVLACCTYIEMNPVRAAMVAYSGDYRSTRYRMNIARCGRDLTWHEAEDMRTCSWCPRCYTRARWVRWILV